MTVNRAFLSSFLHHQGTYLQVITLTDTSLPAGYTRSLQAEAG